MEERAQRVNRRLRNSFGVLEIILLLQWGSLTVLKSENFVREQSIVSKFYCIYTEFYSGFRFRFSKRLNDLTVFWFLI